ncbi:hypothetical protein FQA39_LY02873 [Lamprigera yunnana]|nr:hypothetical protein FQA39_LY02873 [Lamprigera yunnana]
MTNGTGKPKHLQEFVMTAKGRDLELCSGGEEDEYLEVEIHSPTDSSEDSVEVKVSPICLRNKRKCAEPRKVQDAFTAPFKKRMCLQAKNELSTETDNHEPFRPWNAENTPSKINLSKDTRVPLTKSSITTDTSFAVPLPPHFAPDDKPLTSESKNPARTPKLPLPLVKKTASRSRKIKVEPQCVIKNECQDTSCDTLRLRVPFHPQVSSLNATEAERYLVKSAEAFPNLQASSRVTAEDHVAYGRKEQRNYKNMTRERRIEANARERTRVHTISAAFDTLRKSVPAYSHNQKLSKLSVLRIACSYIMTLSTLVGNSPTNEDGTTSTLAECVDTVSKTIQKEGKLRKKKDEMD